jgi:predicted outer membrane protein
MAPHLSKLCLALIFCGVVACANGATPPDSTPVYAEQVAPGVAPISVERLSVNRPEAEAISGTSSQKKDEHPDASSSVTPPPSTEKVEGGSSEVPPPAQGDDAAQD